MNCKKNVVNCKIDYYAYKYRNTTFKMLKKKASVYVVKKCSNVEIRMISAKGFYISVQVIGSIINN